MNSDRKKIMSQDSTGLSLVELLLVLAIMAILTGTGLVYMNTDGYRLRAEANNLKSTLQEARMEAVKRNESASVKLWTQQYETSTGAVVDLSPHDLSLSFSGGGSLPSGGYTITFSPLGTAPNSHYHLKNPSDNKISVRINSVGNIWLE